MEIKKHNLDGIQVAEIISEEIKIHNTEDALDLLGNLYYQGYDKMIVHEENITPAFFDLKTKLAGDILQKFTQYNMALYIIGDFSKFKSQSMIDFICESNKGSQVNFLGSIGEVFNK
ncbi:DUF4180 domain-containing protein [Cyclobacterium amurskyense]|uniref:DUF4180 domain-containing protein n=1 Tax=Cyclobacterium amurskyense TaxID=320787 RepID=UPI0030D975A1|tara:strand:+ start:6113 stop:6463 length:351 start_codon:yes stop_codon:yes gene_type:complete